MTPDELAALAKSVKRGLLLFADDSYVEEEDRATLHASLLDFKRLLEELPNDPYVRRALLKALDPKP